MKIDKKGRGLKLESAAAVITEFFRIHATTLPKYNKECIKAGHHVLAGLYARAARMKRQNASLIIQAAADSYIALPAGYRRYFNRGKLESLKYRLWEISE